MENKAKKKTFTELDLGFPATTFDVKDQNLVDKSYELRKDSVLKEIKDKIDQSGKYPVELRYMSMPFIRELYIHNQILKGSDKTDIQFFCFPNTPLSSEEVASKLLLLQKFSTENIKELSSYINEFDTLLMNTKDTFDRSKAYSNDDYSGDDAIFVAKQLMKYMHNRRK